MNSVAELPHVVKTSFLLPKDWHFSAAEQVRTLHIPSAPRIHHCTIQEKHTALARQVSNEQPFTFRANPAFLV